MNTYQVEINAQWRPETLERILRVVRHRGFVIQQMQMQLQDNQIDLLLSVSSEKAIYLLINQLVKLYDVTTAIVK